MVHVFQDVELLLEVYSTLKITPNFDEMKSAAIRKLNIELRSMLGNSRVAVSFFIMPFCAHEL